MEMEKKLVPCVKQKGERARIKCIIFIIKQKCYWIGNLEFHCIKHCALWFMLSEEPILCKSDSEGAKWNRWTDSEAVATVQVRDHGGLALKVNRLRIYFADIANKTCKWIWYEGRIGVVWNRHESRTISRSLAWTFGT